MAAAAPQPTPLEPDFAPDALAPLDAPAPSLAPSATMETRARARRKKTHQPLRVSPVATLLGFVLLGQVVALLWLQGMAMSARDRAAQRDRDIASARLQIERARDQVSARLSDESRVEEWAQQGGWHMAEQSEIDDVSKRQPYTPPAKDGKPGSRSGG